MQTCYKTEGLTHYFVVLPEQPVRSSYESRLFSGTPIPGFLPLEIREMDGRQALYYRMDYRVSMREASGHLKVPYGKLKRMTGDLIAAMETAEAYLLEPECVVWNPDAIFMDPESGRLQLCYVPAGETEDPAAQEELSGFAEETETGKRRKGQLKKPELPELLQEAAVALLQMADRRDGEGVQWSRRFYDLVTGDCTLEQLIRFQQGEAKVEAQLPVEPEEPYVVQELPLHRTQEAKENSRLEKIVKYGMAASAAWNVVVLAGLLTGLVPDAWVSGLMGGLAVLIVLSLLSMQLYREDSPEEIMRDYFSGNVSGGYGGWNGQAKQDCFMESGGIKMRQSGFSELETMKMRETGFAEPEGMKMRQADALEPDEIKTRPGGCTEPKGKNLQQAGYPEPDGIKTRPGGCTEPKGRNLQQAGYPEPEGIEMYQAGFADSERIQREPDKYREAMGLENLPIDKSARQMADRTQGQTVLLQREMPGQEKTGGMYLQSVERGRYPDVLAGDRGTVLGCLEDACDYILKERGVSRMHAKLVCRENGLYLIDLNSTNGTWINGTRIESGKEYPLAEGDEVAFARCEFVTVHS